MAKTVAVILAGGFGTRIRHLLPDIPKPLAPVMGSPFLEWVIRYLYCQGIRDIVLSTGYLSEKIDDFALKFLLPNLSITCVNEAEPLGTGGGFLNALSGYSKPLDNVLVLNGDSLVLTDLTPLIKAVENPEIGAGILGVRTQDATRFGTLLINEDRSLRDFSEKKPGAGLINAGVYLFKIQTLEKITKHRPISFEHDIFPWLIGNNKIIAVVECDAPFIDIGTEASLVNAGDFISSNYRWFSGEL